MKQYSKKYFYLLKIYRGELLHHYIYAELSKSEKDKEIKDILEKLARNYEGFYSIRINDQWRVVFKWDMGPHEVDIVDYH